MIKKLKRRFMLVMVMIFTFIILAVASGIFVLMLNSEERESAAIMDFAFRDMKDIRRNSEGNIPKAAPEENSDSATLGNELPEGDLKPKDNFSRQDSVFNISSDNPNSMFRNWITIEFDNKGEVIKFFRSMNNNFDSTDESTDTNDEEITAKAAQLVSAGESDGLISIDGIQYRYLIQTEESSQIYSTKIVLLDRSVEIATLQRLGAVIGIIALSGILVVLVLSFFLSKWAVKPIEEAWRKQKEFIANASHELKTPLTVISANTDVILSNPTDTIEKQRKWFGYIQEEIQKMSKLVSSMLYLAREDRDDEKLIVSEFNGSEVIEGACIVFEALVYEKGKTLETEIEADVNCNGDKERVAQLAHILIDNAVSHSAENGYIKVIFKKHKNKVRLVVENNGEPISAEDIPHLFERYYRTDKSHNSEKGGFGLGLAIAKMIVDKHNGTITASSTPEGITRFTVTL